MNLRSRVDKLYSSMVSDVSSRIVVKKDDKVVKQAKHGTNPHKLIQIEVKL